MVGDELTDGHGVNMVLRPAGSFTRGLDPAAGMAACERDRLLEEWDCPLNNFTDAAPARDLYLDSFYIDVTEVTNAMYADCVGAGACSFQRDASSYTVPNYAFNPDYEDYPVIWVPWAYAADFCAWRGARLPTEAEWEKAARGTDSRLYPWGDTFDETRANFWDTEAIASDFYDTEPVGSYPEGASPYGLLDMAGNVAEWVWDWYSPGYYEQAPSENRTGPERRSGYSHVVRGGAFYRTPVFLMTTFRDYTSANSHTAIGFRCALTLSPTQTEQPSATLPPPPQSTTVTTPAPHPTPGSGDAAHGRALHEASIIGAKFAPGCRTGHSLDEGVTLVGPSHNQVGARAASQVSGLSAAEYLRQSIVEPDAFVVAGYVPGIMYQLYGADLSETEIDDLIAFLLTLQ